MGFENGKLVRVVMRAIDNATSDQQVNTFHYDFVDSTIGGESPNSGQSLADFFRDNVMTPFKAMYISSWTIQPVIVAQEMDPQNKLAPRSEWVSGTAAAGTRSAQTDYLPRAACGVASLTTDHIGKRYRGRCFLGGSLSEADQTGGVWQSGITSLWTTYLNAIPHQPDVAAGLGQSVANWGIYSRTNRAQDVDPYISAVQSYAIRTQFRWLRSREA